MTIKLLYSWGTDDVFRERPMKADERITDVIGALQWKISHVAAFITDCSRRTR